MRRIVNLAGRFSSVVSLTVGLMHPLLLPTPQGPIPGFCPKPAFDLIAPVIPMVSWLLSQVMGIVILLACVVAVAAGVILLTRHSDAEGGKKAMGWLKNAGAAVLIVIGAIPLLTVIITVATSSNSLFC